MNKIISLAVLVALVALASGKPQPQPEPQPNLLAYNVAGVPVVAAAPAVASYATVYEQTFHGNLAPATSYVAYSTYDPFVPAAVPLPVAAPVLLSK